MKLDPFDALRALSPARLTLSRVGASQRTAEQLQFELDQARARDAVRRPFDVMGLATRLNVEPTTVRSRARSVSEHLLRPDLGRRAVPEDLVTLSGPAPLVAVVSDGLSSGATERYVPRLLRALSEVPQIIFVPFGRVAIGDVIGAKLGAEIVVVLLGERPGLTDPESLGVYVTYAPGPGRTDADRICLSNIRDGGTSPEVAAESLTRIVAQARLVKGTGVLFPVTQHSMLE